MNVLEDDTSIPDLLAALDEACDADEQRYDDLLVQYGLEVVDPLPADPAEGGSLLLAAPGGPAGVTMRSFPTRSGPSAGSEAVLTAAHCTETHPADGHVAVPAVHVVDGPTAEFSGSLVADPPSGTPDLPVSAAAPAGGASPP
ncbi:hypothetical protein CYMTET_14943 [Cymbomonas tetramitiformis]|uniref:Uncharacterized protein n=1 Tax=Cymbomonas tetramitiformis TaxID=36881 RepID=A0AAE0GFK2_9CHLO|nr:hypothetical protein CYMTET_14943 [Cymbomonas tetramitiformis]